MTRWQLFPWLLCAAIVSPLPAPAQVVQSWSRVHSEAGQRGSLHFLEVDGAGGVYAAGKMGGDDPPETILTIKYDREGNELWVSKLESGEYAEVAGLGIDQLGNAYIAGYADGLLAARYGPDGEELWTAVVSEEGRTHSARALAVDPDGSAVYVTGTSTDTKGFDLDSYIIKLDSMGQQVWRRTYGIGYPNDVAVGRGGEVVVTGQWVPGTGIPGAWEVVTVKYDPAGAQTWMSRYRSRVDIGRKLAIDRDGNVHVAGYIDGSSFEVLAIKYDAYGSRLWARQGGPGLADHIALGLDGEVYLGGHVHGGRAETTTSSRNTRGRGPAPGSAFTIPGEAPMTGSRPSRSMGRATCTSRDHRVSGP